MTWLLGMSATLLTSYVMFVLVPFENEVISIACRIVTLVAANVLLMIASDCYEKLKSRIKALEDKLNDKEDGK